MSLSTKSFSLLQRDIFLFFTNLVTGVVVARKLGPEIMGVWIILQMIPSYAEAFGRLKFDIAAIYFLGRGNYKIGDVVFTLNLLAIVTGLVIISTFLFWFDWFYSFLFSNSTTNHQLFVYLILIYIPIHFLFMNYTYLYIYREDVKTYNRMIVIKALFSSIVGIALLVFFDLGIAAVISSLILSTLIGLIYGASNFKYVKLKKPSLNMQLIKDLLSYGLKLYVGGVISQLNSYITNLIVVFYLIPANVAFFNMAQSKGTLINKVPDAMSTILYSKISKIDNIQNSADLTAKAFRMAFLMLCFVGLLGMVLIKPTVFLLYGHSYLPMVPIFWIILPGLILSGAATVFNQYFVGIGRANISAKIPFFPLLIQVIVSLIMVPSIGIIGAAISLLISLLSVALIQIFIFLKITSFSLRNNLFLRKEDFQVLKAFVLSKITRFKTILLSYNS